ncbi:hypothetical protein LTS18_004709, partial [Coniosporium uncinatum]
MFSAIIATFAALAAAHPGGGAQHDALYPRQTATPSSPFGGLFPIPSCISIPTSLPPLPTNLPKVPAWLLPSCIGFPTALPTNLPSFSPIPLCPGVTLPTSLPKLPAGVPTIPLCPGVTLPTSFPFPTGATPPTGGVSAAPPAAVTPLARMISVVDPR